MSWVGEGEQESLSQSRRSVRTWFHPGLLLMRPAVCPVATYSSRGHPGAGWPDFPLLPSAQLCILCVAGGSRGRRVVPLRGQGPLPRHVHGLHRAGRTRVLALLASDAQVGDAAKPELELCCPAPRVSVLAHAICSTWGPGSLPGIGPSRGPPGQQGRPRRPLRADTWSSAWAGA